jgi:hypothetical protein
MTFEAQPTSQHLCAAIDCSVEIARGHIFCLKHWMALKDETRRKVAGTYSSWQRGGKLQYFTAARRKAVQELAPNRSFASSSPHPVESEGARKSEG